ncbi:hypothetical protein GCM10027035_28360 [Emticicia sediminis]
MDEVFFKFKWIVNVWNNYIYDYSFFESRLNLKNVIGNNYFGDITSYFFDTKRIIERKTTNTEFTENISSAIGFLQAIYVQQDFVEELLIIFSCKTNKGDLKQNPNYSINRDLRNELIGHPIRKTLINSPNGQNKEVLLSSTIFSNELNNETIAYAKYHLDNNYKFEHIKHKKQDIIERHYLFLDQYFNEIIIQLRIVLEQFKRKAIKIQKTLNKAPFINILNQVVHSFENMLNYNHLYKRELLLKIYEKKEDHVRYKNAIQCFLNDVEVCLNETIGNLDDLVNTSFLNQKDKSITDENIVDFFEEYVDSKDINLPQRSYDYTYELGKLVSKDSFSLKLLRKKIVANEIAIQELNHMEDNLNNDLEYYCAYNYLCKLLNAQP